MAVGHDAVTDTRISFLQETTVKLDELYETILSR